MEFGEVIIGHMLQFCVGIFPPGREFSPQCWNRDKSGNVFQGFESISTLQLYTPDMRLVDPGLCYFDPDWIVWLLHIIQHALEQCAWSDFHLRCKLRFMTIFTCKQRNRVRHEIRETVYMHCCNLIFYIAIFIHLVVPQNLILFKL